MRSVEREMHRAWVRGDIPTPGEPDRGRPGLRVRLARRFIRTTYVCVVVADAWHRQGAAILALGVIFVCGILAGALL